MIWLCAGLLPLLCRSVVVLHSDSNRGLALLRMTKTMATHTHQQTNHTARGQDELTTSAHQLDCTCTCPCEQIKHSASTREPAFRTFITQNTPQRPAWYKRGMNKAPPPIQGRHHGWVRGGLGAKGGGGGLGRFAMLQLRCAAAGHDGQRSGVLACAGVMHLQGARGIDDVPAAAAAGPRRSISAKLMIRSGRNDQAPS